MATFKAEEVFDIADKIEENGERFYSGLAKRLGDKKVSIFFNNLAEAEIDHREKYEKMSQKLKDEQVKLDFPGDQAKYLNALADETIFVSREMDRYTGLNLQEAIKTAIKFEEQSIHFYETLIPLLDPENSQIVSDIASQEKKHKATLEKVETS